MKTRSSWPDVSVVAPRVPLCESSSWIMRRKMMKTWSSRCIRGRPQGASLHSFLAAQTQTQHHSLHQNHPCTKHLQNRNIITKQRQTQIMAKTQHHSLNHTWIQHVQNSDINTNTNTNTDPANKHNITHSTALTPNIYVFKHKHMPRHQHHLLHHHL